MLYGPGEMASQHTLSGDAAEEVGEVIEIEVAPRWDVQRRQVRGGAKSCAAGARCNNASPWVRFGRALNLMTEGDGRLGALWRFEGMGGGGDDR